MLRQRLAEHLRVGVDEFGYGERASAVGWSVAFNKKKKDGTAAANILPSKSCVVMGVLYQLAPRQWKALKTSEGKGYREEPISVQTDTGNCDAVTLVAVKATEGIRPSVDYLDKIIAGAREHGLSENYIATVVGKADEQADGH